MTRTFHSSDANEVFESVREHGLKSTGIGVWAGTVSGEKIVVRLVSRRDIESNRLESAGKSFVDFLKKSRLF